MSIEKLENAVRLTFPVINIKTFENSRAKSTVRKVTEDLKKTFIEMPFKALPTMEVIEKLIKGKENNNGYVIFDHFFFDRMKINHENLPSLKNNIKVLENMGINYVITSSETLNEEFVYHLELEDMTDKEIINLLIECEKCIPKGNVFTNDERLKIANHSKGLSYMQMKNTFTMCSYLKFKKKDYLPEIKKEKAFLLKDYGLEVMDTIKIEEVGGLENLKEFMVIRKAGWDNNFPLKGMILRGVQGTGKSLVAKAVADILGTSLIKLDLSVFYSKYVGDTESKFREALKILEKISPVTVLMDEIEKYLGNQSNDSDLSQRLLGTFLTWLQERKGKIFIVGTANNQMPPELTRAGRWDRQFFVDLPNESERLAILKIHLLKNNIQISEEALKMILSESLGYTGAEMEQSIIDRKYVANFHKKDVNYNILSKCLSEVSPISVTRKEEIDEIRELRKNGYYSASKTSIDEEKANIRLNKNRKINIL